MQWPLYLSAKIAARHAAAPFDSAWREFLSERIGEYQDLMAGWRHADAAFTLRRTQALIDGQKDYLGRTAAFFPRRSVNSQLEELRRHVTGPSSAAYVATLVKLLTQKSLDTREADGARKTLLKERDAARAEAADLSDEFGQAVTQVAIIEQEVAPKLSEIDERRRRAAERLQQMREAQEDVKWVNPAAATVGVVAMFAAPAAAAMPIAAGASLTGDLVYRHNTGGGRIAIMTLADAVPKAIEQSKALQDATGKTKAAWEGLVAAKRNFEDVRAGKTVTVGEGENRRTLTKGDATMAYLQQIATVGKTLAAVYGAMEKAPKPTELTLDSIEAEDADLQRLLREMEARRSDQQKHLATLAELQTEIQAKLTRAAQIEESYQALSNGDIENDQDRRRWKEIAAALWEDHFSTAYRLGASLERSYWLLTGAPRALTGRVEEIPAIQLAYADLRVFDALADPNVTTETLARRLSEDAERFRTAMEGIDRAVTEGANAYKERRFSGTISHYTADFSDDRPKGSVEERVLYQVNELVKEAWTAARDGRPAPQRQVFIPFAWDRATQNLPEYFLLAEVSRLVIEEPEASLGTYLRLRIEHPMYGHFYRDDRCIYADFRVPGGYNQLVNITTMPPLAPGGANYSPEAVRRSIEGEDFYTYLPARAPYLLAVSVTQRPSGEPPRVKRIDLKIHYFQ